jgi:hypothetical protein
MCYSEEFRILHSEEVCAVYRSPNIVRLVIMLLKVITRGGL